MQIHSQWKKNLNLQYNLNRELYLITHRDTDLLHTSKMKVVFYYKARDTNVGLVAAA